MEVNALLIFYDRNRSIGEFAMHLTQFTDYSIRTLIFLALANENSTIGDIAARYNISRNHLVKVVHSLSQLGYVYTTRGNQGGLQLAQVPETINLGEVVRQTEPNFHILECFNAETNHCVISPSCQLKSVLYKATEAFMDVLDQYTLADIIQNKSELQILLNINADSKS